MGSLGTPKTLEGLKSIVGAPSNENSVSGKVGKKRKKPKLTFKSIEDAAKKAASDSAAGSIGNTNVAVRPSVRAKAAQASENVAKRKAVAKAERERSSTASARRDLLRRRVEHPEDFGPVSDQVAGILGIRGNIRGATNQTPGNAVAVETEKLFPRNPAGSGGTVDPTGSQNFAVEVAGIPANGKDDRTELKRAIAARIAFARSVGAGRGNLSPQDAQALNDLKDREAFYRQRLAFAHRANTLSKIDRINRGPDGEIDPELAAARGAALDAQIRPAQLSAAESLGKEAQRRMELARRFPQAQGRADEAVRNFADATGRIDNSGATPFEDAARARAGTRDFAAEALAMRQRLAGLQPPQNVADLEARGGLSQRQFDEERLRREQLDRASRDLRSDLNTPVRIGDIEIPRNMFDTFPEDMRNRLLTAQARGFESEADRAALVEDVRNAQVRNEIGRAQISADDNLRTVATTFPNTLSSVLNDRGIFDFTINDSARKTLLANLDMIESLPEDTKAAMKGVILDQLVANGMDLTRLRREVSTPFHFVGRDGGLGLEELRLRVARLLGV